ncbi:MAG: D-alanyl-D-alanine carboxypeptidase [bacterium]
MVQQAAQRAAPDLNAEEIRIDNAAGLGRTNRLSPRAVVALLAALETRLADSGLPLREVLPVAGVDPGTLAERFVAPGLRGVIVGKTGTIPSQRVSALAGVVNTERYGRVRFAILNHTIPVEEARRRQDAFVAGLARESGGVPLAYAAALKPALSAFRIE